MCVVVFGASVPGGDLERETEWLPQRTCTNAAAHVACAKVEKICAATIIAACTRNVWKGSSFPHWPSTLPMPSWALKFEVIPLGWNIRYSNTYAVRNMQHYLRQQVSPLISWFHNSHFHISLYMCYSSYKKQDKWTLLCRLLLALQVAF